MPLYEYQCHRCGKKFEVRQKFADQPLEVHEDCGGQVERLISAPTLQFKGTGWYVTDYGRGNQPPANGKAADGKPAESKPAESKPAPAPSTPSADEK
jgi:putative FmdB family regulatory protein